ncbi:hypothetical protein A2U01_0103455, partial [Trifolium medium]|nr:hypothetical protein [Trifolium medium]
MVFVRINSEQNARCVNWGARRTRQQQFRVLLRRKAPGLEQYIMGYGKRSAAGVG